jgi:hypothetical protein
MSAQIGSRHLNGWAFPAFNSVKNALFFLSLSRESGDRLAGDNWPACVLVEYTRENGTAVATACFR